MVIESPHLTADIASHGLHLGKIAIVGSGIIGLSWALVFARAGHPVSVFVRTKEQTEKIVVRLNALASSSHVLTKEPETAVLARITTGLDLEEVCHGAVYIQESIPEVLSDKQDLFRRLDRITAPDAIIASSTSGLPMSQISAGLEGGRRCLVAHPATPPHLLPVVEIVPSPDTDTETLERTMDLMRRVGMNPVRLMKEQKGFVLNRLQVALIKEMLEVVKDGVISVEDVDSLIRDGFGLRWAVIGPLAGIDLNAPGGIADYLKRYASLYQSEDGSTPLSETVAQALDESLRHRYPLERHAERIAERDRGIAQVRASREAASSRET